MWEWMNAFARRGEARRASISMRSAVREMDGAQGDSRTDAHNAAPSLPLLSSAFVTFGVRVDCDTARCFGRSQTLFAGCFLGFDSWYGVSS